METARVHHAAWRRGGFAGCGTRAAASDAGNRLSQHSTLANSAHIVAAFRKGLHEVGYIEGRNVSIEFRFAEGRHDQLQALTADLVQRQVNVVASSSRCRLTPSESELASELLSEFIDERSRRPIEIVAEMLATIIIDPGNDFFGAFSSRYVACWLGSVLIECSHVTKNPCDSTRCISVITRAIVEPGAARDISLSQNSVFLSRNIGSQN